MWKYRIAMLVITASCSYRQEENLTDSQRILMDNIDSIVRYFTHPILIKSDTVIQVNFDKTNDYYPIIEKMYLNNDHIQKKDDLVKKLFKSNKEEFGIDLSKVKVGHFIAIANDSLIVKHLNKRYALLNISQPVYDKNIACAYIEFHCGKTCQYTQGCLFFLKHNKKKWEIFEVNKVWSAGEIYFNKSNGTDGRTYTTKIHP